MMIRNLTMTAICLVVSLCLLSGVATAAEKYKIGIDIAAKERILNMFLDVNHSAGATIVIASSELEELKRVCDRIAFLYRGRLHTILDPAADDLLFTHAISGEPVLH